MILYLLRHGKAEPYHDGGDSYRELTPRGAADSSRMGRYVVEKIPQWGQIDQVLTSPYIRARQTADLFLEAAALSGLPREVRPVLTPLQDPWEILHEAGAQSWEGLLLVGHNPHLSTLTSFLVEGDDHSLALKTATLAVIDWPRRGSPGSGKLLKLIYPRDIPGV